MTRIAGVDIPNNKRIVIGLTYIYGIGLPTARKILQELQIDENKRVYDLSQEDLKKIYAYIEKHVPVEGQVRQKVFMSIKRLQDIKCYRGLRHKAGMPVRGQHTRKNARTRKGKSIAVGGTSRKEIKK
ncbi:MAG: 30S ribosomal protein S13 [Candidatus Dojkabacteria bacterium]|nr:30S ribosomal protein S13 [Candidatus Dojkabacteria bacterium]